MGTLKFYQIILESSNELVYSLDMLVLEYLFGGLLLLCDFECEVEQEGVDVVDHGGVDVAALVVLEYEVVEGVVGVVLVGLLGFDV